MLLASSQAQLVLTSRFSEVAARSPEGSRESSRQVSPEVSFSQDESPFLPSPTSETRNVIKDGDKRCVHGALVRVADEYAVSTFLSPRIYLDRLVEMLVAWMLRRIGTSSRSSQARLAGLRFDIIVGCGTHLLPMRRTMAFSAGHSCTSCSIHP